MGQARLWYLAYLSVLQQAYKGILEIEYVTVDLVLIRTRPGPLCVILSQDVMVHRGAILQAGGQ